VVLAQLAGQLVEQKLLKVVGQVGQGGHDTCDVATVAVADSDELE
jgi:hypothetical protein